MYLCTFYSGKLQYKLAAKRLERQSKKIKSITEKFFINENKFFLILRSEYPHLFDNFSQEKSAIGFAYWAWKPLIISYCLEKIPIKSNLIYIDVGCNLEDNEVEWKNFNDRINRYELITSNSIGFGAKKYGEQELIWTKPEVLDEFRLKKIDRESKQYQATWIAIKKTSSNLSLIELWKDYCIKDNFSLVRPESKLINSNSSFVRNTADQSVFSCLLKSESISLQIANSDEMTIIKAARNLSLFNFYGNNLSLVKRIIKKLERIFINYWNRFYR